MSREREPTSQIERVETMVGGLYLEGQEPIKPKHKEGIIFIHGSGMNYLSGEPIINTFSSLDYGYPAYTFSLQGHTKSETPKNFTRQGLEMYYRDVKDVSQYLEKQRRIKSGDRILWGHSLGAFIAMQNAKEGTPHALILMNSGFPKQLLQEVGVENVYPSETNEELDKLRAEIAVGRIYQKPPEKVRKYFAGHLPLDFKARYDDFYSKLLSQESNQARLEIITNPPDVKADDIKCPILVVSGKNDPTISIENQRKLAKFFKADYLETDLTHMGMFEDGWPEVARKINKWLEKSKK